MRNAKSAAIDARIGGHDPPRFPSTLYGCYGHRLLPVCCPTAPTADVRDHNLIRLSALCSDGLLVAGHGAPEHLRMDNGPELIAWALRDYCRLSETRTTSIEPGAPWENPFIESFNGRVRDELLNLEDFTSLTVAQVVVEAWRIEYNTYRPHSALGGLTPADYAANWTSTTHPALS